MDLQLDTNPTEIDQDDKLTRFASMRTQRERLRLQNSLHAFAQGAWGIVEPEHDFVDNWHIQKLCVVLEDLTYTHETATAFHGQHAAKAIARAYEDVERAIINVPPGTMKSLLVSVIWPCWVWARNPRVNILTAAYSDKRAIDANLKARKILQSIWFQRFFPMEFTEDSNTKGRYDVKGGGWRIATSVGGEGTGLHPDYIIIDDASTAQDAQSDTSRKEVTDWMGNTVSSRGVSRNVVVVVIGQRLHEEDLSGFLLASPNRASWKHVCWPMRFEPTRPAVEGDRGWTADPLDPRTTAGELLWPALFNETKVAKLELDLAEDAAGQLQQNPMPKGGRIFKTENFKYFDVPPARMVMVRGWDTGATEGGGDPSAGALIGEAIDESMENGVESWTKSGRFYVLDMEHAQLGPEGVDALIIATAKRDGPRVAVREQREGGSSGKTVTLARAKALVGYDYEEVLPGTNKRQFSKAFRAQVNAGNVYLPKGSAWVNGFVRELNDFPNGKHDDQVDAVATAFNSVLLEDFEEESGEYTW